uniref:Aspartyl/glutamyl-tRNA(Asn/Gln) amidotransferase subunit B n=1 Tax=candidate division WOR-3 bacterium TaxID=2052148 RepID=A0A7C4U835_UNCW3
MELKPVIGIEVHSQLNTKSKIFCGCKVSYEDEPNKNVCPICLGHPGVLPVLNKKALELALKVAIALNCEIDRITHFSRKNYFYPDLPKGYQISQFTGAIGRNGYIEIENKKIRIRRVHIEEETAKIFHIGDYVYLDFNRCGIPLIEIVTEPDISTGDEAVSYLKKLQGILRFLDASYADMEKGMMRCEPNISISVDGKMGTKTEIKNLNSFRAVKLGIDYEIERQKNIILKGGRIEQVTMLWDEEKRETRPMRWKETASDYRYFPEPDLPPLIIKDEMIEKIKKEIPELPEEKKKRYINIGVREYEAEIISQDLKLTKYFEGILNLYNEPSEVSKWLVSEILSFKDYEKISFKDVVLIIKSVKENKISRLNAKEILRDVYETGKEAEIIMKEKGFEKRWGEEELKEIIKNTIEKNKKEFERLKNGEEKLVGFFVGEIMKQTKGKADPKIVNKIIREYAGFDKG